MRVYTFFGTPRLFDFDVTRRVRNTVILAHAVF